jgi:hypothetical protein
MDSYSLYPEAFPLVAETLEYRVSVSWISRVPFSISISCSQWGVRLVQRYLGSLNCHPLCSLDTSSEISKPSYFKLHYMLATLL